MKARRLQATEWTRYSDREPDLKERQIMVCEPGGDKPLYLEAQEITGDYWLQNGEAPFDWSDRQNWLWAPCPKPPSS